MKELDTPGSGYRYRGYHLGLAMWMIIAGYLVLWLLLMKITRRRRREVVVEPR